MRHCLCLFVVSLFVASTAARDIFVDNRLGDDRRDGTTPVIVGETGPCRSIAKALRIARPEDRIVLANTGRPYRESITLEGAKHSGTSRYPFTLYGNGAVLDGTVPLAGATWEYVGGQIFHTRPPHMSYQQLFLNDLPAVRTQPPANVRPQLAAREWY